MKLRHCSLVDASRHASEMGMGYPHTTPGEARKIALQNGQFSALDRGTLLRLAEATEKIQKALDRIMRNASLTGRPERPKVDCVADALRDQYASAVPLIPMHLQVKDLRFSVRATNCLRGMDIRAVAQLVQHSPEELLETRNFGRGCLKEVQEGLGKMGLALRAPDK
jgi:DNA-directed RNA polymerase alpha subunit